MTLPLRRHSNLNMHILYQSTDLTEYSNFHLYIAKFGQMRRSFLKMTLKMTPRQPGDQNARAKRGLPAPLKSPRAGVSLMGVVA